MDNKNLLKQVNSQGYLFQLAVEEEISNIKKYITTHWHVASREYRWIDPVDKTEKFIDLVLEATKGRIIVECKRVKKPQDAPWIFLVEPGIKRNTSNARILWSATSKGGRPVYDWSDLKIINSSPESSFCVLLGQDPKSTPMLERVAGTLLRSSEAIAETEVKANVEQIGELIGIYYPMIVTNAELKICKFSPKDIELASGILPDADFESVPIVRFRKSLSSSLSSKQKTISDISKDQERTVFIVNFEYLKSIFPEMEPIKRTDWPWLSTTEYH